VFTRDRLCYKDFFVVSYWKTQFFANKSVTPINVLYLRLLNNLWMVMDIHEDFRIDAHV